MTSSELVPTAGPGRTTAVRRRRRAEPDIISPAGERISASAARRLTNAVPRSSRNARSTRWRSYAFWCATYDWAEDEPNSVLSYAWPLDRGGSYSCGTGRPGRPSALPSGCGVALG